MVDKIPGASSTTTGASIYHDELYEIAKFYTFLEALNGLSKTEGWLSAWN